jgi:hypothetical protein
MSKGRRDLLGMRSLQFRRIPLGSKEAYARPEKDLAGQSAEVPW